MIVLQMNGIYRLKQPEATGETAGRIVSSVRNRTSKDFKPTGGSGRSFTSGR